MDKHVNLLYMQDDNDMGHFVWIKDLSCLVRSQLSRKEHKKFFTKKLRNILMNYILADAYTTLVQMKNWSPFYRLQSDEWLRDQIAEWKRQVAEFRQLLQEERVSHLSCTLSLSSWRRKPHVHHRVFSVGYYVHCSYDDSLPFYRFCRDKDW